MRCRATPACKLDATHAESQRFPDPVPSETGWVPICWQHALHLATQVGSPDARYTIELASLPYAIADPRSPLVEYVRDLPSARGRQRGGFRIVAEDEA